MGLTEADREEIWQWAEAVCEGTIPPEDLSRLEARLEQSQKARMLFLHYLHLHGELYWHLNLLEVKHIGPAAHGQNARWVLPAGVSQGSVWAGTPESKGRGTSRQETFLHKWPFEKARRFHGGLFDNWKEWVGRKRSIHIVLVGILVALAAILALPTLRDWRGGLDGSFQQAETLPVVAQVVEVWNLAATSAGEDPAKETRGKGPTMVQPLPAGSELHVGQVAIRLAFPEDSEAIFEGPGRLRFKGKNQLTLTEGALALRVSETSRQGYEIETPFGKVRDLGTSFAVRVGQTEGEVHVFEGQVEVIPVKLPGDSGGMTRTSGGNRQFSTTHATAPKDSTGSFRVRLATNQALRLLRQGNYWNWETAKAEPGRFLRSEDSPPYVPRWRMKVQSDPRLAHLWSFEGWTVAEKLRDWRGELHLHEVFMFGGSGGGRVGYFSAGASSASRAVWPFRPPVAGNSQGVGFQTAAMFQPSDAFTVECILAFRRPENPASEDICVILGSRGASDGGSFLLGADGYGQLLVALDPNQGWLDIPFRLLSNDWYYLAVSFRKSEGELVTGATVDLWAANLNQPGPKPIRVLAEQRIAGWLGTGWLGVGKGFETGGAHAYPWAGLIDEVALYKETLNEEEIVEHFQILTGAAASSGDGKAGGG